MLEEPQHEIAQMVLQMRDLQMQEVQMVAIMINVPMGIKTDKKLILTAEDHIAIRV